MEGERQEETKKLMQQLGSLLHLTHARFLIGKEERIIRESQELGEAGKRDRLAISWHVQDGQLKDYEIVLRKHIDIPGVTIAGIDVAQLESRMQKIDWTRNWYVVGAPGLVGDNDPHRERADAILRDVQLMSRQGGTSQEIVDQLLLKYLAYSVNGPYLRRIDELKAAYEQKLSLIPDELQISVQKAYNLFQGRAVSVSTYQMEAFGLDWYGLHPTSRTEEGSRVLERLPQMAGFNPFAELRAMGVKDIFLVPYMTLLEGSKILTSLQVDGKEAARVLYVNPRQAQIVFDKEEGQQNGLYQVTDEELYESRLAKARRFLPDLQHHLTYIGVDKELVNQFSEAIIVAPRSTQHTQEVLYDQDKVKFTIDVGKNKDDSFSLHGIQAELRRSPRFTTSIINGVNVPLLESSMQNIDWRQDFTRSSSVAFHRTQPGGNPQMLHRAEGVYGELSQLFEGNDLEGKYVAAALAIRYLKDTPNERFHLPIAHEMERWQLIVPFPAQPVFTLQAMYNMTDNRFAIGRRSGESKQWYQLDSYTPGQVKHPRITLVPGRFSVENYLRSQPAILEANVPFLLRQTAIGLEEGDRMPLHVAPEKFPDALFAYADPIDQILRVDLSFTLRRSAHHQLGLSPVAGNMTLDAMLKEIGIKPARFRSGGRGGKGGAPDDDPPSRGKKR